MKKKINFTWSYIVIRKSLHYKPPRTTEYYYDIHEGYDFVNNIPTSWTQDPVDANRACDLNDLRSTLALMISDSCKYPVFEERRGKLIKAE